MLLILTAISAMARTPDGPVVEVFLPHVNQPLDRVFYQAQGIAEGIYARIGMHVVWRVAAASQGSCGKRPGRQRIVVEFSWQTAADFHPGATAVAFPYAAEGKCLTVFMDRLEHLVAARPTTTAHLLGHVLAHEMGHVLEGVARHAETGLMSGRWSEQQIRELPGRRLEFTPADVELIRAAFH
jgi:hypothetical protein